MTIYYKTKCLKKNCLINQEGTTWASMTASVSLALFAHNICNCLMSIFEMAHLVNGKPFGSTDR